MNNIILAVGDSGSAVNFIRNLITLSDNVHWPHDHLPRLDFIINTVYPSELKNNLGAWMGREYKLRNWDDVYSIDVAHEPTTSILTPKVQEYLKTQHVAFMVHWVHYARKILADTPATVVTISPETEFGVLWQIRAFVEKCGIDFVPNYTFTGLDINKQKSCYIEQHGLDAYRKENTLNMQEIVRSRVGEYSLLGGNHGIALNLEDLFTTETFIKLVEQINNYLLINIDLDQALQLRNAWWDLHWPVDRTLDFPWLTHA